MTGTGRYWSNEILKLGLAPRGEEKAKGLCPVGRGSSSHLLPHSSHTTLKEGIIFLHLQMRTNVPRSKRS